VFPIHGEGTYIIFLSLFVQSVLKGLNYTIFHMSIMRQFNPFKKTFASLSIQGLILAAALSCSKPVPTIEITDPAAGAMLVAGDTISIKWTPAVSNPVVSYNYNFSTAAAWQLFATVLPVSSEEVKVVLPVTWYSDSFQIKVEDASGGVKEGVTPYLAEKYIFVTSPVAGQTVKVGDSVVVSWRHNPALFSSLEVQLSTDSGKSFSELYSSGSFSKTTSSVAWVVGSETGGSFLPSYPSSGCVIRVRDYSNYSINATSGLFTVALR
jgi:hypothetical protein